ncbi:MAG: ROK family transcriptional regulator [Sebaldella sp.]|nr:ROK family transcriptional regulator [Sebaldella sp.]
MDFIQNDYHKRILSYIYLEKKITKIQLSKFLDVTIPTVTLYLNELIKNGLIKESGVINSEAGRKPVLFEINSENAYTIGIEIRQETLSIVILDLELNLIYKSVEEYNIDNLREELQNLIYKSIVHGNVTKEQILGIGIAFPGIVNDRKLELEESPIVDIKAYSLEGLKEIFKIPVYIGNEADYAAYAENLIGSSEKYKNSIYLSIHEGIGGGIILENALYSGTLHHAGEIGHMVVDFKGRSCDCGRSGCWEKYVSSKILTNLILENKLEDIKELLEIYNNKSNEKIYNQVDEYFNYLSLGIMNLFLIFDLDCIIIGGVLAPYQDLLQDVIIEKIKNENCKLEKNAEKIIFPKLLSKASAIGAGIVPLSNIYDFDLILKTMK